MRILVIGGTRFMGPAVVERLVAQGHHVTVFHRGQIGPELPEGVGRLLGDRRKLGEHAAELRAQAPDLVLDMIPMTEQDALDLIATFRGVARRVVAVSSQDVYRNFGLLLGKETGEPDPLPVTEESPVRGSLYPYRGAEPRPADSPQRWMDEYDKILVERAFLSDPELPGTVLRLPAVYGPRDGQRRLYSYLKRMDDGRPAILLDEAVADWRWTRGYMENVADAIALACTDERAAGRTYNIGEQATLSTRELVEAIARVTGWQGEILVRPADRLPGLIRLSMTTRLRTRRSGDYNPPPPPGQTSGNFFVIKSLHIIKTIYPYNGLTEIRGRKGGRPMILVVGATGYLGSMIVRQLLASGRSVRMLVREGSAYQGLAAEGATPVFGDLKEKGTLERACAGVETVITTANAVVRGEPDTIASVDDQGNRDLIDAAKEAGVKQFIFVSVLGADPGNPNPLFAAKGRAEAHLKASGMAYTILQGEVFMDIWVPLVVGSAVREGRPVMLIGEGSRRHTLVATRDVAAFAVNAVGHPAAQRQTFPVAGPEPLAWRDVIAAFERRLGRAIPVQSVAPGTAVPGVAPFVLGLMTALETYDSVVPMAELAAAFGVKLTRLDELLDQFLTS